LSEPLVRAIQLSKTYAMGKGGIDALERIDLDISAGRFVSIMGPSGSGKSTLLHLLGGLDRPTSGTVIIEGSDLFAMKDEELTAFRRRRLGFVFQFFNILPTLSAWENVALPLVLDGKRLKDLRGNAEEVLSRVGLENRSDHKPGQLSGGEMQRVAIARALIAGPSLVLADEPTGNLDSASSEAILRLLRSAVDEGTTTVVMVTHDNDAAGYADTVVRLSDGKLIG